MELVIYQQNGFLQKNSYNSIDGIPVGLRVLVIDNCKTCLHMLGTLLDSYNCRVSKFEQAIDALFHLRVYRNNYDFLLAALHNLGLDGLKLLEIVSTEMNGLPVIITSADERPSTIVKAVKLGCCEYLLNPLHRHSLRNIWQHVIRVTKYEIIRGTETTSTRVVIPQNNIEERREIEEDQETRRNSTRAIEYNNYNHDALMSNNYGDYRHDQHQHQDHNIVRVIETSTRVVIPQNNIEERREIISTTIGYNKVEEDQETRRNSTRAIEYNNYNHDTLINNCGDDYRQDQHQHQDHINIISSEDVQVTPVANKKQRLVWTSELHGKFVEAVTQLGNEKAVPKKILEAMQNMGCQNLSRENVASHLQKYRMYMSKPLSGENQPSNTNANYNQVMITTHQPRPEPSQPSANQVVEGISSENLSLNQESGGTERTLDSMFNDSQVISNFQAEDSGMIPGSLFWDFYPASEENDIAPLFSDELLPSSQTPRNDQPQIDGV